MATVAHGSGGMHLTALLVCEELSVIRCWVHYFFKKKVIVVFLNLCISKQPRFCYLNVRVSLFLYGFLQETTHLIVVNRTS